MEGLDAPPEIVLTIIIIRADVMIDCAVGIVCREHAQFFRITRYTILPDDFMCDTRDLCQSVLLCRRTFVLCADKVFFISKRKRGLLIRPVVASFRL